MGIGRAIERRLIPTFPLAERIIPRFGMSGFCPTRNAKRALPDLLPAIAAISSAHRNRGSRRDQQSHRKRLETQPFRGAPWPSPREKLLRLTLAGRLVRAAMRNQTLKSWLSPEQSLLGGMALASLAAACIWL